MATLRPKSVLPVMIVAILLPMDLVLCAGASRKLTAAPPASAARLFMASLPLNISVVSPPALATGERVWVSGVQDITAVFSRPVIALGSDLEDDGVIRKASPFRLSCDFPGKSRWVTTSIARYDPDQQWPSDLSCDLIWNTGLKTYDGVKLQLGEVPVRSRLVSQPLSLIHVSVVSDLAANLTSGQWVSDRLMREDKFPEVPPDGRVVLYFSYTVNLKLLSEALELLEGNVFNGNATVPSPKLGFTVQPCTSPVPWLSAVHVTSSASLDVNSTCAEVVVGPVLRRDTWYTLRLPAGSQYNHISGRLAQDIHTTFCGLRPFRIPFLKEIPAFDNETALGFYFRRWDMYLPHGLARNTTAAALAANIAVCWRVPATKSNPAGFCMPVAFNLTLEGSMVARLNVPGAQPGRAYRVTVSSSSWVKDGFGQNLQASSGEVGMQHVEYRFAGPVTRSSQLAVLEAGVDSTIDWPYITRSPAPSDMNWPVGGFPRNISTFYIDVNQEAELVALLASSRRMDYYDSNVLELLGVPDLSIRVERALTTPGGAVGWTEIKAPLGSAVLQLQYSCCTPESYSSRPSFQVILRTNLSLSVVQSGPYVVAWVTDAVRGGGSGALAGVDVSFYAVPYSGYYEDFGGSRRLPYKLASCTTNAQGHCTTKVARDEQFGNSILAALAKLMTPAGVRVAMLPYSGWTQASDSIAPFVAKLVIDRKLVEPGDSLKITGFVQAASLEGLSLPRGMDVQLSVSPEWTSSSGFRGSVVVATAQLNAATGTFHAEVAVPPDARMTGYDILAYISDGGNDAPTGNEAVDYFYSSDVTFALAAESFTVSSPRTPTAELKLVADPWATPNGTATVNVTAVSYIGAAVDNSTVSVKWAVPIIGYATGVLTLKTDANGFATTTIDLAPVAAFVAAQGLTSWGGSVDVEAEWIGPTRERITQHATITVADSPVQLSMTTSIQTDLPGVPFTVAAVITSNADGTELLNLPVNVTLRPATAAAAAVVCAANDSCTTLSGASWASAAGAPSCRLALPCVGQYLVEGCADVPYSGSKIRVCGSISRGEDLDSWARSPLSPSSLPTPVLQLDKPGGYRPGEVPQLRFDNPYSKARLLVVWGTTKSVRTKSFSELPAGALASVSLEPLGSECAFGCELTAVLDVPRVGPADLPSLPPTTQLPVATLFDPRAPHSHVMTAQLSILPENELEVSVMVSAPSSTTGVKTLADSNGGSIAVVEPGATAEVTVDVRSTAADGPVEVTVYGVEKAFLDLAPYDLPRPAADMLLRVFANMQSYTLDQYRISPGAVRAVYDKLMARLTNLDPWLPVDTSVLPPSGGLDRLDIPDAAFLSLYTRFITAVGGYRGGLEDFNEGDLMPTVSSQRSPPPPSRGPADRPTSDGQLPGGEVGDVGDVGDDGGSDDNGGTPAPAELRRSSDFVVTPLFAYKVASAGGVAAFNFTAPPNLGAFVIRAFAAAGSSAKYGSAEGKLVVRRSLSLTPSVPAFVRVGDVFEAGVVVTVGSAPANVTVTLRVLNSSRSSLRLVGLPARTVVFSTGGGGLQTEVRFNFSARAVGPASLVFSATDSAPGGGRDSVQLDVPVEGQQGDVWVATSFALASNASAGNSSAWVEGMVLPGAVPGSGGLSLTAGVGYLPAVTAVYDNLLVSEAWWKEPYAQPAIMWTTLPAVLSYYDQTVSNAQAAEVAQASSDLAALTSWYGLSWTLPTRWSNWWQSRTDVSLNTWALFLVKFHNIASSAVLSSLVPQWRAAVDRQVVADVAEGLNYGFNYSDWNTLAWIRLALGADWAPAGVDADPITLELLSLERTLAVFRNRTSRWQFDRQTRVLLSLVLLSMGARNPEPQLVTNTVTELTGSLRVQGRTTYLAVEPGSPTAAALEDQALALLLLTRTGARHQLVPKLAAYVASPTTSSGGGLIYIYAPWSAQAVAVAALTEYDRSRGSSRPSLDLTADVNGLAVLQASFRANSSRTVRNTTAWEALPPSPVRGKPSDLEFALTGTGEVTVAASLHFVPSALPSFPTYRGLSVDLAIQMIDPLSGRPTGPRVRSVPLGSLVLLTVQLTSPDDLSAVTLSVMMPGGLEPLDPNLVPDAGSSCFTDWFSGSYGWQSFLPRWWWWPVCPLQETRPSVVTYNYAALRAGTSTVSIKAVAATTGRFVVPPVRASVDEQPEVMGATAAGTFVVCAGCTAATPAAAPRTPRPCPGDCSDNGVCNLRTGVCVCDDGFTGEDCSSISASATRRR